jgi:hypothetical protein
MRRFYAGPLNLRLFDGLGVSKPLQGFPNAAVFAQLEAAPIHEPPLPVKQ